MQFAIHDIVKFGTRGIHATNQGGARGCTRDGRHLPQDLVSPFAAPINIPKNDPYYGPLNVTCMDFVTTQKYNGECIVTDANPVSFYPFNQLK